MPTLPSRSPVTDVPALGPAETQQHFARLLELETDCWDVHASLEGGAPGFVLLDVRSPERGRSRSSQRTSSSSSIAPAPIATAPTRRRSTSQRSGAR